MAQAVPQDQPYNSGAPYIRLFGFDRGQNTGVATFVGTDTGKHSETVDLPNWLVSMTFPRGIFC